MTKDGGKKNSVALLSHINNGTKYHDLRETESNCPGRVIGGVR